MLKALIFDFDGVIVDTETQWYEIYRNWLKTEYQYELDIKDYLVCVGSNNQKLFEFLRTVIGPEVNGEEFERMATEEFIRRSNSLPPMKGVVELIKKAKEHGLKLGIATSATKKKPVFHLKRLGLLEYFDAFSTADICRNIKPAPDLFLKAAELLGATPNECLAVEDSGNGLISANRAGMRCLLVPNNITRHCEFEPCYRRVESLEEVELEEIEKDFQ
ncbi:MAG: HAD-IA family hydrolase [Clostridiales bacterium]|nr:HAD-IA family hydrolase [Clostridiales bacterium]